MHQTDFVELVQNSRNRATSGQTVEEVGIQVGRRDDGLPKWLRDVVWNDLLNVAIDALPIKRRYMQSRVVGLFGSNPNGG
jgi:hypothetical protein